MTFHISLYVRSWKLAETRACIVKLFLVVQSFIKVEAFNSSFGLKITFVSDNACIYCIDRAS